MESAKYSLNTNDLKKVGQAMAYSALSALLASVVVVLSQPNALNWRTALSAILVPTVNGALVALKKYTDGVDFDSEKALRD